MTTIPTTIDAAGWLRNHMESPDADSDLLAAMLKDFAEALMSAEASAQCQAAYNERTDERTNSRNGYRTRRWDTRAGTIDLAVPKLRADTYYPDWLLTHRKRSEQALASVIAQSYVGGVSTRRVVNVSTVIATAVNVEGRREVIGFDVVTSESTASWTAFLRGLVARGLSGVELVISDAHGGIKAAIGQVLTGASWQRCRTHFMANLSSRVTKASWPMVAALVRSIFEQPDRASTWDQLADVVDKLTEGGFVDVAERVLDAADEILAFTAFPVEHWVKIRSNNPQERLNKEIRRRTNVVGIFPNRASAIRLIGALLVEQTDEWAIGKRYMSAEPLNRARQQPEPVGEAPPKEVTPATAA